MHKEQIDSNLMDTVNRVIKETRGSSNLIDKIYRSACRLIQSGQPSTSPGQVNCKYVNGYWV